MVVPFGEIHLKIGGKKKGSQRLTKWAGLTDYIKQITSLLTVIYGLNLSPWVQLISEWPVQLVLVHESLALLAPLQDFHTQFVITENERFVWPSFHSTQELLLKAEDHISRFLQPKQGSA